MTPQQQLEWLRSPGSSLPALGYVVDQQTSQFIRYDPNRITNTLQQNILAYYDNPPITRHGQYKWLTVLTARQMGKSLVGEYAAYVKAAYTPGFDHVTIADTKDRADYLHTRVHQLHLKWREDLRTPKEVAKEARTLTFDKRIGGRMRVLSAETEGVGVGQSPDSFHGSEAMLWSDFAGTMSLIYPAMINRNRCYGLFEATPWEAGCAWHDHCIEASRGIGRHFYYFAPFWDGKLNRRTWDSSWAIDMEEEKLLNLYAGMGLTLDHLAFRREMLQTDIEIRRNPNLFAVFYPFDDVTCWQVNATAAIPAHALERHMTPLLLDSRDEYFEIQQPDDAGVYVIGVDPCGFAARDHAAFQVLRVYSDKLVQVARYCGHTEPVKFTEILLRTAKKYRRATIAVESNGVGQAVLGLLRQHGYDKIYYDKPGRPGFVSSSQSLDKSIGWLIDSLMDSMVLYCKQTVTQLSSYKHDKRIEESATTELIRGGASKRRRDRHHWDLVSALIFAVVCSRKVSAPAAPKEQFEAGDSPAHSGLYTYKAQSEKWAQMQLEARRKRRRAGY